MQNSTYLCTDVKPWLQCNQCSNMRGRTKVTSIGKDQALAHHIVFACPSPATNSRAGTLFYFRLHTSQQHDTAFSIWRKAVLEWFCKACEMIGLFDRASHRIESLRLLRPRSAIVGPLDQSLPPQLNIDKSKPILAPGLGGIRSFPNPDLQKPLANFRRFS